MNQPKSSDRLATGGKPVSIWRKRGRYIKSTTAACLFGCTEMLLNPIDVSFLPTDCVQYEGNVEAVRQQLSQ